MDGYDEWLPLSVIEDELEPAQPVAKYPTGYPQAATSVPAKSRGIYIILGLLGGCLGLHNFYIARYGSGAAQLAILVLTGWLIVPIFALALWVLIELFAVDRDGKGRRLD